MYIFVNFHGKLMSEEVIKDKTKQLVANGETPKVPTPEFQVVNIRTMSGEKQVPIPKQAVGLLNQYNDEFNLAQQLGESIKTTQRAQSKATANANNLLLELLGQSNQASMEIGKLSRDKEVEEAKAKSEAEAKKKVKETKEEKKLEKPSKPPAKKKSEKTKNNLK